MPTRPLAAQYREEYDYYPEKWVSPYIDRRRENGWSLYGLLGITKGDKDRMHAQHQRNFRLFDAPVGLMFTLDKVMGQGSLVDYGMFLQSIMVAARARGLHTCPQAAWNGFARSSCRTSARARTRCWCAAWPWAMPMKGTRSTPFTRRVCLSKNLRAGWVEPVPDASCLRSGADNPATFRTTDRHGRHCRLQAGLHRLQHGASPGP
jgi:hypothetical protein